MSSLVSMKKNQSDKNTPMTHARHERIGGGFMSSNHGSHLSNSEYMVQ